MSSTPGGKTVRVILILWFCLAPIVGISDRFRAHRCRDRLDVNCRCAFRLLEISGNQKLGRDCRSSLVDRVASYAIRWFLFHISLSARPIARRLRCSGRDRRHRRGVYRGNDSLHPGITSLANHFASLEHFRSDRHRLRRFLCLEIWIEGLAIDGSIARVTVEFAAHVSRPAYHYLACADFHQSSKSTSEGLIALQIVVVTA